MTISQSRNAQSRNAQAHNARADATAFDVLGSCRALVEPALRAAVGELPASMRRIVGYHYGWLDENGRPVDGSTEGTAGGKAEGKAGGKALRPALTLLAAEAVAGPGFDRALAVPAAVAVDLVHNFSLLHDDVMDRDRTRRHRPTAWVVFGVGPAILAGDALLILAMDVLTDSGLPGTEGVVQMLARSVQELVEGQIADLAFERRPEVSVSECLAMAEAKTGSLLGAACALGAVFAGSRPEQAAELGRFGRELGVAFQLVDDVLGIWGEPAVTGKPVNNDLRSRKKSLPVVAALASGTAAGREFAELYRRDDELMEHELARAAELIELAGGRAWCRQRADQLFMTAENRLSGAGFATGPVAELRLLARLMVHRSS